MPAVCLTLAACPVLVRESRNPAAPPLDAAGVLLSAGAVTCLVWGVIDGPERGWTAPVTWLLLAGSAALLAAFLGRERRAAHPLIDRQLFLDRRFTWGTVASVAVSVALFAILFVIPQYLQSVAGDDPITAGLRLLPMMGGLFVAGVLSQVHLATGYVIVATGLALCGLGVGMSMAAAMDQVMAAAGGDEAGAGASLNSTLRQVGGAIAVAVLGSVLSAGYAGALQPALDGLPVAAAACRPAGRPCEPRPAARSCTA